jgi:hypothetical protein
VFEQRAAELFWMKRGSNCSRMDFSVGATIFLITFPVLGSLIDIWLYRHTF